MVIAVIAGLIVGIVGFIPLFIGLRMTRKVTRTSNFGHMAILIISLVISFALLFVLALVVNALADHDSAMAFVFAEAVGLSVAAIGFGISRLRNNKGRG